MKNINQKEHTSFSIKILSDGDVEIMFDSSIISKPLVLENEFRRETALALCPELENEINSLEAAKKTLVNMLKQTLQKNSSLFVSIAKHKHVLTETRRIHIIEVEETGEPKESMANIMRNLDEIASLLSEEKSELVNENDILIKSETTCPTCGSEVTVGGDSETHFYIPKLGN